VAQGWLFLASDRNRLAREVDLYELKEGKLCKVGGETEPVKRGPGRPRKAA